MIVFPEEEMDELEKIDAAWLPASSEMAGLGAKAGGGLLDFIQQIFIV